MADSILFCFFAHFPSFILLFGIISLLLAPLLSGMCCIALGIILITHLASLPSILLYFRPTISLFCPFLPFFGVPSFSPLPLLSLKPSGKYSIPLDLFPLADFDHLCLIFQVLYIRISLFCTISSSFSAPILCKLILIFKLSNFKLIFAFLAIFLLIFCHVSLFSFHQVCSTFLYLL